MSHCTIYKFSRKIIKLHWSDLDFSSQNRNTNYVFQVSTAMVSTTGRSICSTHYVWSDFRQEADRIWHGLCASPALGFLLLSRLLAFLFAICSRLPLSLHVEHFMVVFWSLPLNNYKFMRARPNAFRSSLFNRPLKRRSGQQTVSHVGFVWKLHKVVCISQHSLRTSQAIQLQSAS